MATGTLETYTTVPLTLDPSSKTLTTPTPTPALTSALTSINALHTTLKTLDTPSQIPPPPIPVNPKRSAQIAKLRDAALGAQRKGQLGDAARMFGFAIDMAASRPPWEPMGLMREELAGLYAGRGAVRVEQRLWVEGWKDAESSVECKKGPAQGPHGERGPGNQKAWVVGGKCLREMGRWEEARRFVEQGAEVEGTEGDDGRELGRELERCRKAEAERT